MTDHNSIGDGAVASGNNATESIPMASSHNDLSAIAAVSVKPSPFWKSMPVLWFDQLESQFELSRITNQRTKYNHVLSVLEGDIIRVVSDVVRNPHPTEPYNRLKETLINRLSASENSKLSQLVNDLSLGDRQPSQLLREMRELGEGRVGEDFLRTLWLQRLPENMQAILACTPGSLSELATCADKISEVLGKSSSIFALSSSQTNGNKNSIDDLAAQMAELKADFKKLLRSRSSSRNRFRSKSRSRHISPHQYNSTLKDFCWYHQKFGIKASKCIDPCSFSPKNPKSYSEDTKN